MTRAAIYSVSAAREIREGIRLSKMSEGYHQLLMKYHREVGVTLDDEYPNAVTMHRDAQRLARLAGPLALRAFLRHDEKLLQRKLQKWGLRTDPSILRNLR